MVLRHQGWLVDASLFSPLPNRDWLNNLSPEKNSRGTTRREADTTDIRNQIGTRGAFQYWVRMLSNKHLEKLRAYILCITHDGMTGTTLTSRIQHFTREQLEAIDQVLKLLDSNEYRDYHDQFGVCNAPDIIESLQREIQTALKK